MTREGREGPEGAGRLLVPLGPEALERTLLSARMRSPDARRLLLPQLPALLVPWNHRVAQTLREYLTPGSLTAEEVRGLVQAAMPEPRIALALAMHFAHDMQWMRGEMNRTCEDWGEDIERLFQGVRRLLEALPTGSPLLAQGVGTLLDREAGGRDPGWLLDQALRVGREMAVAVALRLRRRLEEPGHLSASREERLLGLEDREVDVGLGEHPLLSASGLEVLRGRYREREPRTWGRLVATRRREVERLLEEGAGPALKGVADRIRLAPGELRPGVLRAALEAVIEEPEEMDAYLVASFAQGLPEESYGDVERARIVGTGRDFLSERVLCQFRPARDRETLSAFLAYPAVRVRAGLLPKSAEARAMPREMQAFLLDELIPRLLRDADPSIRRQAHRLGRALGRAKSRRKGERILQQKGARPG